MFEATSSMEIWKVLFTCARTARRLAEELGPYQRLLGPFLEARAAGKGKVAQLLQDGVAIIDG